MNLSSSDDDSAVSDLDFHVWMGTKCDAARSLTESGRGMCTSRTRHTSKIRRASVMLAPDIAFSTTLTMFLSTAVINFSIVSLSFEISSPEKPAVTKRECG